jgi:phosphatidylglycerophosphatase A
MLVSLASLPWRPEVAGVGFLLFRLFDIWKPFPARAAERLPGGLGVMADDLVAGVFANLGGQVLWRLWVTGA